MSTHVGPINPSVLAWARNRSGLTIQEVAERLGQPPERIAAWESGQEAPTYSQLENLADTLYRRPVALFFLPSPPEEPPVEREFRTLPHAELDTFDPDTRFAVRDTIAFQSSLRELTGGSNPVQRLIHRELTVDRGEPPESVATRARQCLGIALDEQCSWSGTTEAMTRWRDAVEANGVFVRKRSFKQREISGFCVWDSEFPVIVINNSTAFSRQIFTLFHELAHLIYRVSSITKRADEFMGDVPQAAKEIEQGCNRFASEFLLPSSVFQPLLQGLNDVEGFVTTQAHHFHVSREVILRRLLDLGAVDQATYRDLAQQWNADYDRPPSGSGGNYYATQATYLGRAFIDLAFRHYYAEKISLEELADHLGMKAKNVHGLEAFARLGGQ